MVYQHGIAYTIVNIGYTLRKKEDYDKARIFFEESLRLSLEMKDQRLQSFAEGNIGQLYLSYQVCYKAALHYLDKAIEGHQRIGFKHSLAEWHLGKGLCFYELEEYEQAFEEVEKSIEICEAIQRGDLLPKAQSLKEQILKKKTFEV